MIRHSIVLTGVFAGVLAVLTAVGCGMSGSRRASKPKRSRPAPAAVDLRGAEQFAVRHLGRFDELTCVMKPMANAHASPQEVQSADISCTALQRNHTQMMGISFHCTMMGASATGPACRFPALPQQSP